MTLAAGVAAGTAGLAVAFAAGAVSIATPCSWPLIPGYLAYVSGVAAGGTGVTDEVCAAVAAYAAADRVAVYDVTADGRRFLMIKDEAPDKAYSKQLVVVLGWADELNRASSTT